uniref:Uncharacterized protein n=1 Tax=Rhizophora mucronata TaxID=61149 RepID=A0A2P2PME9_RHIMU
MGQVVGCSPWKASIKNETSYKCLLDL